MSYRLESIELFVRPLPQARMPFVFGKALRTDRRTTEAKRRPPGLLLVHATVTNDGKQSAIGMSGDRPSFGWLDKRDTIDDTGKLDRLLDLITAAREVYLEEGAFANPFELWRRCYRRIQGLGAEADHEALSASFASALFERAVIDAVCRIEGASLFEALHRGLLGVDPGAIFPQLEDLNLPDILSARPRQQIFIRHTVGGADPITAADLTAADRVNDGEPETLEEYVARDGLRYFKVKVFGDPVADLERLRRIWQVVMHANDPVITLDGNESYDDLATFERFVDSIEGAEPGLSDHLLFIEQPLPRALTLDPATTSAIHEISRRKALVIDEADGDLGAFPGAFAIGYSGVSHKNCKGFFKSLLNLAWCRHFEATTERAAFMTGEDLSNLPRVPLHQDFAALALLGIEHCERNGHHYNFGLSHLTAGEKALVREHHPGLYIERGGELFLNIRDGAVDISSLQVTGFGVAFEPDWNALIPFNEWKPV